MSKINPIIIHLYARRLLARPTTRQRYPLSGPADRPGRHKVSVVLAPETNTNADEVPADAVSGAANGARRGRSYLQLTKSIRAPEVVWRPTSERAGGLTGWLAPRQLQADFCRPILPARLLGRPVEIVAPDKLAGRVFLHL